ncbi:MAG: hypothetical protein AVDCRST_MAG19-2079 [uncultured Thermomicrobiales bacterium]|uniref:Uncharacterized protein n=1 Tax=uncultured Thermomicrobiales bacterium TaxID=1645740 RepID=A0A6J4V046_9BACT|nr:MAG: hypothetical protein AVDCRST_MAG19-2079 [uncultured Thermomicrobiales bacterium]
MQVRGEAERSAAGGSGRGRRIAPGRRGEGPGARVVGAGRRRVTRCRSHAPAPGRDGPALPPSRQRPFVRGTWHGTTERRRGGPLRAHPAGDRPPAAASAMPLRLALPDSRRVGMREDDVEGRPPSQLAIGPDPPATLLDDLAGDRQAKARSRDAAADARLDPAAPIRPARSERPRSDGGLGARRSIPPSTPRARFTTGRGGRGI